MTIRQTFIVRNIRNNCIACLKKIPKCDWAFEEFLSLVKESIVKVFREKKINGFNWILFMDEGSNFWEKFQESWRLEFEN